MKSNASTVERCAPWAELTRWNRAGIASVALGAPAFALSWWIAVRAPAFGWTAIAVMAIVAVTLMVSLYKVHGFKCPRCRNKFFVKSLPWGRFSMTRKCVHCALPLYSDAGAAISAAPLFEPGGGVSDCMSDLPPLPAIEPGRYRHYKGGEYEVVGVVRHSETLEPLVLYRPLYNDSGMWVRPFAMFLEDIEFDGRKQPRFVRIPGPADSASGSP